MYSALAGIVRRTVGFSITGRQAEREQTSSCLVVTPPWLPNQARLKGSFPAPLAAPEPDARPSLSVAEDRQSDRLPGEPLAHRPDDVVRAARLPVDRDDHVAALRTVTPLKVSRSPPSRPAWSAGLSSRTELTIAPRLAA